MAISIMLENSEAEPMWLVNRAEIASQPCSCNAGPLLKATGRSLSLFARRTAPWRFPQDILAYYFSFEVGKRGAL